MKRIVVVGALLAFSAATISSTVQISTYEVSIYTLLPVLVWGLLGVSMLIAIYLTFSGSIKQGISLGIISIVVIGSLPLLLGWYMISKGDPMSHVGFTRDILLQNTGAFDILYPVIHVFAIQIHQVLSVPINQALLIIVPTFVLLFVLGGMLSTRELSRMSTTIDTKLALTCGAFSALLLLPVNNIGMYLVPQPTSQGVMAFAFALFLFISLIRRQDNRLLIILFIYIVMLAFVHPIHSLILSAFLIGLSLFSRGTAKFWGQPVNISGFTGLGGLVLTFAWASSHGIFNSSLAGYIVQFYTLEFGGGRVGSTSSSLSDLGSSLIELGLRTFGVQLIFVCLTAVVALWALSRETQKEPERASRVIWMIALTLVPLAVITLVLIAVRSNTIPFRLVAVLMIFGTVFGALALSRLGTFVGSNKNFTRIALCIFFVFCLLISIPTMFPSPFVLKESGQITEAGVTSYKTIAETSPDRYEFRGVRTSASRYFQAIYGVQGATERGLTIQGRPPAMQKVPDHFSNQSLQSAYGSDFYLNIHVRDRMLETGLYEGFRYNKSDFIYLDRTDGISLYYDSGWVTSYRVDVQTKSN
ncbi:hypothetical protein [Halorubrum ezzemoulense]|uniref:hypothetical protein n=1 Tax=Halorubrum ezzemoulense TaxID=337243 RepID=UPI00113FCB61|nr:hypothetical protein [Halorubrum ezzemoulense]